jgi:hypothetical protein
MSVYNDGLYDFTAQTETQEADLLALQATATAQEAEYEDSLNTYTTTYGYLQSEKSEQIINVSTSGTNTITITGIPIESVFILTGTIIGEVGSTSGPTFQELTCSITFNQSSGPDTVQTWYGPDTNQIMTKVQIQVCVPFTTTGSTGNTTMTLATSGVFNNGSGNFNLDYNLRLVKLN